MSSLTEELPKRGSIATIVSIALLGAVIAGLLYASINRDFQLPPPQQAINVSLVAPEVQPELAAKSAPATPQPISTPEPTPTPQVEQPPVEQKVDIPVEKPKPKPVKKVVHKPVAVGDVVSCHASCIKTGNSSITINVEVWIKKVSSEPIGQRYCTTEAVFIYVAVDEQGKPRSLPAQTQGLPHSA